VKLTALIVDDETSILTTLRAILEGRGFEVHEASSAKVAKEKIAGAFDFDLVLTDMRMESDTAGYEVVSAANSVPRPPVTIIISAYSNLSRDWKERGANALFEKPTNIPELLKTIDALLQKRETQLARAARARE
jgi:DNA-binding NtrC family response regulator